MLYKLLLLAATLAAISSENKVNQQVQISINRRLLGTDERDSSNRDDGYNDKNGYVNGDGNKGGDKGRGYGWDKSKSNSGDKYGYDDDKNRVWGKDDDHYDSKGWYNSESKDERGDGGYAGNRGGYRNKGYGNRGYSNKGYNRGYSNRGYGDKGYGYDKGYGNKGNGYGNKNYGYEIKVMGMIKDMEIKAMVMVIKT
eukprot:800765_1